MENKLLEQYDHFISLGYFCEVAKDLEELGLRDASSPFDWCISDFEGVIKAINNNFEDFMNLENLQQSVRFRQHYLDTKYGVFFFHDFSKYISLEKQQDKIKKKYVRRIERFYESIKSPTLFFRYISNEKKNEEGKSVELQWIEENYDSIFEGLRRFNKKNNVVFIGDEDMHSDSIKIFNVKKDDGDCVSRHPIINNFELINIVKHFTVINQERNKMRFIKKQTKKKTFLGRVVKKIRNIYYKHFGAIYIHMKEYDILGK